MDAKVKYLFKVSAEAYVLFFRFEAEIMKEWKNCSKDVS